MTTETPVQSDVESLIEKIAREIDPLPFEDGWVGMPATRAGRIESANRKAAAILALPALSASVSIERELEAKIARAHRSLRALQKGAALALSQLGVVGDGPIADFLCAIYREAVRGLADDRVTNEAAP